MQYLLSFSRPISKSTCACGWFPSGWIKIIAMTCTCLITTLRNFRLLNWYASRWACEMDILSVVRTCVSHSEKLIVQTLQVYLSYLICSRTGFECWQNVMPMFEKIIAKISVFHSTRHIVSTFDMSISHWRQSVYFPTAILWKWMFQNVTSHVVVYRAPKGTWWNRI